MDLTPHQFQAYYHSQLDAALAKGHHFVVGDAKGVDADSLDYVLSPANRERHPDVAARITVYCSRPRNVHLFEKLGVRVECAEEKHDQKNRRARHLNRDAVMTKASDYDILWARTDAEAKELYGAKWRADRISATELNRRRRVEVTE
ncbi:hypothetical protein MMC18_002767 [Xylographa bjoerkii]|nr:hypothetical protein [Xylographa bjoerkii]